MQNRNIRLKRCSCGNLPQVYETKYGDWYVACPVCSKQPIPTYFTRKDAIKAWNMSHRRVNMKAYLIKEVNGVYDYATVVFAETRNKAKIIGMNAGPFWGVGLDYMDVEAKRIPKLDKYYRGLDKMDWDNDEDRIAMVKDGNFSCSYEFEPDDCETCPAKQWCDRY